ncbi:hypothetical protein PMAYCL1PPCAC_20537, partial [Pristionchus mayeri]
TTLRTCENELGDFLSRRYHSADFRRNSLVQSVRFASASCAPCSLLCRLNIPWNPGPKCVHVVGTPTAFSLSAYSAPSSLSTSNPIVTMSAGGRSVRLGCIRGAKSGFVRKGVRYSCMYSLINLRRLIQTK